MTTFTYVFWHGLERPTRQDNWNFYLQLTFAKLAGIKFPFGPGHSEEEFEAFHHYTLNQHFFAKGGNESESTSWLHSVFVFVPTMK